jgi:hypothetical protein
MHKASKLSEERIERLLYGTPLPDVNKPKRYKPGAEEGAAEARAHMEKARQLLADQQSKQSQNGASMTVSLYTSNASGKTEIVVQTNAQTLDLFVSGLADALVSSLESMTPDRRLELISSMLRNAFPVGFAIAGYKAERVTEARVLVCGAAAPAESSLLAHSRS